MAYDLNLFAHPGQAPKIPPTRRWDEMPGRLVDPDVIRSMTPDDLHRDRWTIEKRIEMWQKIEAQHQRSREKSPGYPVSNGLYILSGPMGSGKSLYAVSVALAAHAKLAIPVFSPVSAGLLFGRHITLEQMYQFPDILPQGSILVCDEIAALADASGTQAMRNRTLGASMTAFRKSQGLVLGASAAEWAIAGNLRVSAEATITPSRYWPKKSVVVGYTSKWEEIRQRVPLKRHELEFPEFCYMTVKGLKVPWDRRRIQEDFEQELRKARAPKHRRGPDVDLSRWHPIKVAPPWPQLAYCASALYDTFSRVPVSDQHFIDADRIRAAAYQAEGAGDSDGLTFSARAYDFLQWSLDTNLYDNSLAKGYVEFERLMEGAIAFDAATFKGVQMTAFKRAIQKHLPDACTRRRVEIDGIMALAAGNKS